MNLTIAGTGGGGDGGIESCCKSADDNDKNVKVKLERESYEMDTDDEDGNRKESLDGTSNGVLPQKIKQEDYEADTDDDEVMKSSEVDEELLALKAKGDADAEVARGEWASARSLYLKALNLVENSMEIECVTSPDMNAAPSLAARIHANLAMVFLKENDFEDAVKHANLAVEAAPAWGKAYARLGAAQEANGMILDAAQSLRLAVTAKDAFSGAQVMLKKLEKTKYYRKLSLIREFQQQDCYAAYLENEGRRNDNALAVMNEQQKELLRNIRAGRVLPNGTNPELVKQQDHILYLATLDASFNKVMEYKVETKDGTHHPFVCQGMHAWLHYNTTKNRDEEEKAYGGSRPFNIYDVLLNGKDAEHEYGWKRFAHEVSIILLVPNREFEERGKIDLPGLDDVDPWGATLMYKRYAEVGEYKELEMKETYYALVSLNYFILVRAQTDVFNWDNTVLTWSVKKQELVSKSENFKKLYAVYRLISQFMRFWNDDVIPRDSFEHKPDD